MGRKKKTLKKKKLADLRLSLQETPVTQPSLEAPKTTFSYTFTQVKSASRAPIYSLTYDIRKTLIVSFGILFCLLLLSLLLHNHAFVLPLVSRY